MKEPDRPSQDGPTEWAVEDLSLPAATAKSSDTNEAGAEDGQPTLVFDLSGRIVGEDEEPVAGAALYFAWMGVELDGWPATDRAMTIASLGRSARSAVSGSDGTFSFSLTCPAGRVFVEARADGYAPKRVTLDVSEGEKPEFILFHLKRAPYHFRGRVTQWNGAPVTDAYVSIKTWDTAALSSGQPTNSWSHTDEHGDFLLTTPDEGVATLQVVSMTHGKQTFSDVFVRDGGWVELALPRTRTVLHGEISWQDGTPAVGTTVAVSGDFVQLHVDEFGKPTGGHSATGAPPFTVLVDRFGYYRTDGIDSGQHYTVYVLGPDGKQLTPPAALGRLAEGAENRWDAVVSQPIVLEVTVRGEQFGRGIPDVKVLCVKLDSKAKGGLGASFVGVTDEDGGCELAVTSGVGDYGLRVFYQGKGAVTFSANTPLDKEIHLPPDGARVELTVPDQARLRCYVTDANGRLLPGVSLDTRVQTIDGVVTQNHNVASTGEDGLVEVTLEPDTVVQGILSHEAYAPALTDTYSFEPGSDWEETVVLYPAGAIRGTLTDPEGNLLVSTPVVLTVFLPDGTVRSVTFETDSDGQLWFDQFPATSIALDISATLYSETQSQEVSFQAGEFEVHENEMFDLGIVQLQLRE